AHAVPDGLGQRGLAAASWPDDADETQWTSKRERNPSEKPPRHLDRIQTGSHGPLLSWAGVTLQAAGSLVRVRRAARRGPPETRPALRDGRPGPAARSAASKGRQGRGARGEPPLFHLDSGEDRGPEAVGARGRPAREGIQWEERVETRNRRRLEPDG